MALSIFQLGDRAILVTLGDRIDPEINDCLLYTSDAADE